jgi:hypothetical protein
LARKDLSGHFSLKIVLGDRHLDWNLLTWFSLQRMILIHLSLSKKIKNQKFQEPSKVKHTHRSFSIIRIWG